MVGLIIALSVATSIFFITSIVVLIRRKQKATRNVGYVISDGAPVMVSPSSHAAPLTVMHYPPPGYQQNAYAATYSYPAQTTSHVHVQMPMQMSGMQAPMPGHQVPVHNATMSGAEVSVLAAYDEKPATRQTHQGAVETVSQI